METIKEQVFLLFTTLYREADIIANFLSPENGKLTAVIYGGKRIGKPSSFSYHPGDRLEIEYQVNEGRDFIKVKNTSAVELLKLDDFSYERFLFHSYLLELFGRISHAGNPAAELYEIISQNNHLEWKSPYKLQFILWCLWQTINQEGFALDYHSCCLCERASWQRNPKDQPAFRKEIYQLYQNTGLLVCNRCHATTATRQRISGAMIKVFWMLETYPDFYQQAHGIPPEILLSSIHLINHYLLQSFEVQPNSLPMFLSSLEKY